MPAQYPYAQYPPDVQPSWWRRQSRATKIGAGVLTAFAVLLLIGVIGAAVGGTGTAHNSPSAGAADPGNSAQNPIVPLSSSPAATTTNPPTAPPTTAASPKVETKLVTQTVRIPFTTKMVSDSSLPKGTQKTRTRGVAGVKTLTYQVTITDGKQTSKKLVRTEITKQPVTQVIAIGTKNVSKCDPNYTGACVPIASDVDCAGGSGDGPAYVTGPVYVVGTDIYHLDSDHDGVGCEP